MTMKTIDAHTDAMRTQDEAWKKYNEANDNAQRASIAILDCRMKNTIACDDCDMIAELSEIAVNNAMSELYRAMKTVNWLHAVLLMDPEYVRWISTS